MEREILRCEHLTKSYGDTPVLRGVSFSVREREIFFLLGPSGCGKTTILRIICGFVPPDRGKVFLRGKEITDLPAHLRSVGLVFQNYALWPHLTVRENVAYGLRVRGVPSREMNERVERMLSITGMLSFSHHYPSQLSGGQQQRVALCRTLVIEPDILLLDEPLSNLDAKLRETMREEIRSIQKTTGVTMVYVTHDQKEALSLGNRVAVLNEGQIVQTGAPDELYFEPANEFVAGFIGTMNFFDGTVAGEQSGRLVVETQEGVFLCPKKTQAQSGQKVRVGFRPEVPLLREEQCNTIRGVINGVDHRGELVQVRIETQAGNRLVLNFLADRTRTFTPGSRVVFSVAPDHLLVYPG